MTDYELMICTNRAHNGRLTVLLLFAANVVALFAFGGTWALYGMVLAVVTVAAAYLLEAFVPRVAEVIATAAAVGSAICFLSYLF